MNASFQTLTQYGLAALALVALVVLNLWGTPDPTLSTALLTLISTTVWGGIQREQGRRQGTPQVTPAPPDQE